MRPFFLAWIGLLFFSCEMAWAGVSDSGALESPDQRGFSPQRRRISSDSFLDLSQRESNSDLSPLTDSDLRAIFNIAPMALRHALRRGAVSINVTEEPQGEGSPESPVPPPPDSPEFVEFNGCQVLKGAVKKEGDGTIYFRTLSTPSSGSRVSLASSLSDPCSTSSEGSSEDSEYVIEEMLNLAAATHQPDESEDDEGDGGESSSASSENEENEDVEEVSQFSSEEGSREGSSLS